MKRKVQDPAFVAQSHTVIQTYPVGVPDVELAAIVKSKVQTPLKIDAPERLTSQPSFDGVDCDGVPTAVLLAVLGTTM